MATSGLTRTSTRPGLCTRDEVAAIRELLRQAQPTLDDYWKIGEQMRRLEADSTISDQPGWRRTVAEAAGGAGTKSTLDKALQLRRLCPTKAELEELKKIDDRWSFVLLALGVLKKKERHALLRQAERDGWSAGRLQAEIQGRTGAGAQEPRRSRRRWHRTSKGYSACWRTCTTSTSWSGRATSGRSPPSRPRTNPASTPGGWRLCRRRWATCRRR
jgi:hypothetical protein